MRFEKIFTFQANTFNCFEENFTNIEGPLLLIDVQLTPLPVAYPNLEINVTSIETLFTHSETNYSFVENGLPESGFHITTLEGHFTNGAIAFTVPNCSFYNVGT